VRGGGGRHVFQGGDNAEKNGGGPDGEEKEKEELRVI